jgi:hypothetical protein
MTEVVEGVNFPNLEKELEAKCPFKETPPGKNPSKTPEDASEVHENDGGKLGDNLKDGLEGDPGTFNDKCPCKGLRKEPCLDSRTRPKLGLRLKGGPYPFIQAAHHLIPGVASLENSDLFKTYMNEGDKVTTKSKPPRKYTIAVNIGYCVNGAHNGVWLPGNYAIREKNPANPKEANWGDVKDADFKWNYTIAAIKKCEGRQFHDAHGKYNSKVKGTLNKICKALIFHQDHCGTCANNSGKKVPPPYTIKLRLYGLSKWLKGLLTGPISGWKDPYFTSSKVHAWFMDAKKKKEFMRTYKDISP